MNIKTEQNRGNEKDNKASRGRVGRSGNARFHTFQLDDYGPADGQMDEQTKPLIESLVLD